MSNQSASIDEARLDIFGLEPGIALENGLWTIARGEHAEHMLHGEPMPTNDRLPAEDLRVDGYPLEELIFLWNLLLHGPPDGLERRATNVNSLPQTGSFGQQETVAAVQEQVSIWVSIILVKYAGSPYPSETGKGNELVSY